MSIRSLYTISVIGQNRLGFVSKFLKKIYEADGNIINSSMKTLGDNYTLNIQTEFPKNIEIGRFLNKNIDPNSFFVFANSSSTFDEYNPYYPIDIQVKLADTSGVIYATTDVLSNISAHVDSLKSSVEPAPMCSTPLFTLDMTAMIPTKHEPDFVCNELESIKDRFDCDIYVGDQNKLYVEVSEGKEPGWAFPIIKPFLSRSNRYNINDQYKR